MRLPTVASFFAVVSKYSWIHDAIRDTINRSFIAGLVRSVFEGTGLFRTGNDVKLAELAKCET
jgi:hypothetical protein